MGKGSGRRPVLIGREEHDLRKALAHGGISRCKFDKEMTILYEKGKVTRSGRILK
ncbi:MAG: hypothetical protein ACYTEX_26025 [Planctomycetota bacterium]|jgi:hypothetical protein